MVDIARDPAILRRRRKRQIALGVVAVLVMIGSFFRGTGFNFAWPWLDGLFFEL